MIRTFFHPPLYEAHRRSPVAKFWLILQNTAPQGLTTVPLRAAGTALPIWASECRQRLPDETRTRLPVQARAKEPRPGSQPRDASE